MKKLLNFVVILSLAVSFVFAGGSGEESSEDGVVLTLWGSSQTMVDFYEETVIPAFLEAYPQVADVEVLYMPIEDFVQRLAVVLPAGEVPDIMEIEDSWATPYVTAGYFEPNTPELNAIVDQMLPSLKTCLTYDGQVWGVPIAPFHELFFWNLDMLAEAGYTEIPDTWDEVVEAAVKMTQRDATGKITRSGFSMRLGGNPSGTAQKFWVLGLLPNGVNWYEESATEPGKYHAGFDNEGGYNALKTYIDLLYKYQVDDFASLKDTEAFANGKTAINMREASSSSSIIEQGPDINWTTSPMPKGPVERSTFLISLNFYVPVDGKHKDLAREFIKFATTEEMYEIQVAERAGFNPYIGADRTKGLDERLVPAFTDPEDLVYHSVPVHSAYDTAMIRIGEALPNIFADKTLLDNPEGIKAAVHQLAEIFNDAYKEFDEYAE